MQFANYKFLTDFRRKMFLHYKMLRSVSSHSPMYLHMSTAIMHHSLLQQAELVLTTLFDYVILALPGLDPGMSVPYGEDDIHYTTVTDK